MGSQKKQLWILGNLTKKLIAIRTHTITQINTSFPGSGPCPCNSDEFGHNTTEITVPLLLTNLICMPAEVLFSERTDSPRKTNFDFEVACSLHTHIATLSVLPLRCERRPFGVSEQHVVQPFL